MSRLDSRRRGTLRCGIATSFGSTASICCRRTRRTIPSMLGPATKRDAIAHLKAIMGLSERRACQIISADRKTIRYLSSRPPEIEPRAKLRDLANERRRFGYRRLFILLRRDGEPSGVNRIYRLYREEGLPYASATPGVVLLARVPRSSSKQRQMPAGHWISSTINSPAASASASSMWSTMSRANAWLLSLIRRSLVAVSQGS